MDNVRLGIIGLGNMGVGACGTGRRGQIPHCELAAVCDVDEAKTAKVRREIALHGRGGNELLGSGRVDAVLIATPHFSHVPLGVAALSRRVCTCSWKSPWPSTRPTPCACSPPPRRPCPGVRGHVQPAHRPALPPPARLAPERRAGGRAPGAVDGDRLVSPPRLLCQRGLARLLGGRGRRRVAQPVPAQPGPVVVALWPALPACAPSVRWAATIPSRWRTT